VARLIEESHVLLHPVRFQIVNLLAKKPMHISDITKAMGEERPLVSYHLDTLEEYGFVNSKYEISEESKLKGKRVIRTYEITDKVAETIETLKKVL
jgi:DNA-binding transcriptional ArsR family regulator